MLGIVIQKMYLRLSTKDKAIGLAQTELRETFKHYRILNIVHHVQLSTYSSLSDIQLTFSFILSFAKTARWCTSNYFELEKRGGAESQHL